MRLRIPIRQGERYPRGYGFVWIDFVRNEAVCYPIPLNIVLRLVYVLWIWCLMPFRVTEYERLRSRVAALEDEVLSLIKRKDDWIGRYDRLRKFVGDPERGARP